MIDTAGTLVAGAQAIHEAGARCIYACATHPVFSEPALQRLDSSVLEQVVVCDTIPVDPTTRPEKVRVLSVAQLIGEAIRRTHNEESISSLFV